jgi:quercetin dioxygenase-like cupin family protein
VCGNLAETLSPVASQESALSGMPLRGTTIAGLCCNCRIRSLGRRFNENNLCASALNRDAIEQPTSISGENAMMTRSLTIALALSLTTLHAQQSNPVVVKQVVTTSVNSSGQPIILPRGDAQLTVSVYDIPAGANLPEHQHPFPRYGYVLAGNLRVLNTDTAKEQDYKPGDFILEAVGQWHKATATGTEPVRLLVIDIVEPGKTNTILKQ